ncbi:conserved hypothetical protein [Ricinus communis]|uniref:Uncharacterized protein n=1 Tax=Ricinus communis TaxID=3988 RepID=B9SJE9_RICCO|nr:conserved hypothetical protein [Ricinus communis]
MPGNKVEDGIHNIYELDNCSRRQHPSQAVGGSWPEHDYNQWVGKPAQIVTPPNFNLKNYSLQRLDTVEGHASESLHVPFDKNYSQLTPRSEYSRSLTLSNPLSANEFLLGCQNFLSKQNQPGIFGENTCYDQRILNSKGFPILKSQHENECADSPTLTTNSERSEITEASSDFNFLTGQQQLARDQELSATQNYLMQQPGYNDMQLLQQHMMFKQLQEFQRQQQLQQLGDLRPQNSLNQFSTISRQTTGGQFSPLINGTPVHDASQMLRNWMHRGASPATQGLSNKAVFSQEQGQALRSMGLTPQQLDASLYGSPTSNTRGNMSQYAHLQGLSHESVNLLAKASGQVQKSMMQSSGFGGPYLGDQPAIPDPIGLTQGALISKQEILMKNNSGQAPFQGLNSGVFTGNLPEVNTPQVPASGKEFSGRHEQAGWPAIQQTKQLGASQGLVPLDPMEAKILYNMDDNIWDAFGSRPDTSAGGLGNTLEHPDSSYAFPSIQSGSWSALMQSAVAEASSSDTGLQEEWSGLTFQNTEQSTDNQISNFVDSEKQPTGWVDNNLQSASSFSSKPFPMITDSSMNSSFPGFQHPGTQISVEQREDICQDGSHESIENYNPQQKSLVEDGQKVQTIHSDNAWSGQMFEHSQNAALHQKGSSSNITLDNKGSKSIARTQHQMSNGPHVALNSFRGVNETREMQHNYQQKESSNDCSRGSSSHEQGHIEQFKFFGNVPSSVVSVDKVIVLPIVIKSISSDCLFQIIRAPDEVPSRGDHGSNASTNFHGSVLPDGSNATDAFSTCRSNNFFNYHKHGSEHMLELLHKVDHLKDDSTIKQFESTDCNSLAEMPGADSHDTSVTQMYAQSCASQGFGLRLAPPSQRLANSNSFLHPPGLPQTTNNPSSRQVNPESGDKNQAWLTPSLFQSSPHPYELAQRAHWDNKSGTLGQANFSRYMNMQGSTAAPFSPGLTQARSQPQMRPLSNVPVTSQSLQAALPGATTRFPPFNHALSQDASQQTHSNADNQQFPVLNTLPKSQHPNISGMSQPDATALTSGLLVSTPQQQEQGFDKARHSNNMALATSEKNLDSFSHSHHDQQNYSLLHQVQAMNNGAECAAALGGQQLHDNISRFRRPRDDGLNSTSVSNSFPSGDGEMLSFPAEAREGVTAKAPLQTALQSRPSQEMARFGYNDSHVQSSSSNELSNHMEHGHVNLHMAHSLMKQYGALRNGQMAPMFDARLATAAALQLSRGKPSQNLHIHTPLEMLDVANVGQGGRVWPSAAAALVASQQLSSPYMLPPEVANQMAITRTKKRKVTEFDLLPWHKEVTQDSKRLQNISLAEQDWAQATNRLIEKVEDEVEVIEDLQPMHRTKRRLILTTQLVQQLFRPAPASIFSRDAASSYGIISYFVSRLSLGDACSLAYCTKNDFPKPVNNDKTNSEKLKISERSGDQKIMEVVEEFTNRANKLDNDFQRLDMTASVVDVRAEFQELERFAVINRFAKFHVRGQMDASGTSSSSAAPKPIPQRHVLAFPMPRNLPEGVQCLSL